MVTKTVFKHIRGFVIAWSLVTGLVCMATFLAVYYSYDAVQLDNGASNPLPLATPSAAPLATPPPDAQSGDAMRFQAGILVGHSPDLNQVNQDNYYRTVATDLGLPWVKQQLRWDQLEAQPGVIDWRLLDFVLPSAERFELKLLLSIMAAPSWAREPDTDLERLGPPADPAAYANFVAAIIQRYPGRIQSIEVWNEQNSRGAWTTERGLLAADYVALLKAAYQAVKAIDPGIIVISGALSPTGIDDGIGAVDNFRYMDALIEAGLLDWADCVGAQHNGYNVSPDHRYNEIPQDSAASYRGPFDNPHHSWSFRSTLEGYANRIRAAGHTTMLCVTAFGWPSAEGLAGARPGLEFALDNSLAQQAEWLPLALSNMEAWGFVRLAFISNLNYGPQAGFDIANENVHYSLIGPPYDFRPAFDAIRAWQRDYVARDEA